LRVSHSIAWKPTSSSIAMSKFTMARRAESMSHLQNVMLMYF
jgi:hypothetical protein